MYYLKGVWNDGVLSVDTIYNMDAMENASLDTSSGILVEEMPEFPQVPIGKGALLKADSEGEIWFEEVEIPLTIEQETFIRMGQQQDIIDMLLIDALTGGAE